MKSAMASIDIETEAIKRVDHQIHSLIDDIAYFMGKRESHLKGKAAYLCYLGGSLLSLIYESMAYAGENSPRDFDRQPYPSNEQTKIWQGFSICSQRVGAS